MNSKYYNIDFSYAILRNVDPVKLEIEVIEFMENGWEPTGGVSVSNIQSPKGYYYTQYTQAMVRK